MPNHILLAMISMLEDVRLIISALGKCPVFPPVLESWPAWPAEHEDVVLP
jgi:hypothetical protein